MPKVTSTEMFKKAYEGGYAIGAFNVNNMEIIQGITEAAQQEKSPIILQVSAGARKYAKHVYLMKLIEAAIEDGQEMLARARENSNVSQIDCINTQLVIARGFLNVAQNANINLKEAITRNDAEATTHHQKLLDLAVEKTEGAAARMKQCGTGVLSVTGETQSTTKRDCKVEPCLGGEEVYAPDAIEKQSLTGADKIDASNNVDASPYM